MILDRRSVLAGLALAARPLRGADTAPPAVDMAVAVTPPVSADGLLITDGDKAPVPVDRWRGRWVVLNLWAPWCLPCRREMPSIERLSRQLDPAHVALVPLAFEWRGPIWVQKFYRENGITDLPVFLGDGENMQAVLGLSDLPTTAILDPEGRHVMTVSGEASWDDPATLAWVQGLGR